MCGRAYETYTDEEIAMRYLNEKPIELPKILPTYNLCPTQLAPVVFQKNGQRLIRHFRWGLVPSWAKDVKDADKYSLINAKSEDIETKKSYAHAFREQRCVVPISGFFEWFRPEQGSKKPYAIRLRDSPIMSVAGVWESWTSRQTGEIVESFSILTVAANEFMSKIHNRMPVILDLAGESLWLDETCKDITQLKALLKPCPNEWLVADEVSTLVNSPRNNSPEILNPVASLV